MAKNKTSKFYQHQLKSVESMNYQEKIQRERDDEHIRDIRIAVRCNSATEFLKDQEQ